MSLKILVVDDEPNMQPLIRQIFRQQIKAGEYIFGFATTGKQAMAMLHHDPAIDIVLTDINMPGMDGLTLLHKLTRYKATVNPVLTPLVISAYDDMQNIRRAMNEGAFDFLTKPIDPQDLRSTLKKTGKFVARLNQTIAKEKQVKKALQHLNTALEQRVQARTAELSAANESLKASNAELDAFAHTVAHDLKSPLTTITGYASMLVNEGETLTPAELTELHKRVYNVSRRTITIVEELLLLAGVRQQKVTPTVVDIRPVVLHALERLAEEIKKTEADISLPQSWPAAIGYAPWLEEVWANYISNGLKYGGRPPRLALGAAIQPDGMVRFWVKDFGPGIEPIAQAQLFTEFTRLNTNLRHIDGHGLGLAIVKRIVEKLGGSVGVDSQPGQGSTFYFTLKAADQNHSSP